MMPRYEYIRLYIDPDDLGPLNRYSKDGWRVVSVIRTAQPIDLLQFSWCALLERELPYPLIQDEYKSKAESGQ